VVATLKEDKAKEVMVGGSPRYVPRRVEPLMIPSLTLVKDKTIYCFDQITGNTLLVEGEARDS